MLSVKASSHDKLFSDCIKYVYFFLLSPLLMTFLLNFVCNYWVPLATRHAFLMASTSPMYFYISLYIHLYVYEYCEMKTNKLELELFHLFLTHPVKFPGNFTTIQEFADLNGLHSALVLCTRR